MKKTVCELKKINLAKPVPVLWIGNGINQSYECDSWNKIIKNAAERNGNKILNKTIQKLPSSMQIIVATKDHVDNEMKYLAKDMQEYGNNKELINFIKTYVLRTDISTIITTNYTYEIEKAIDTNYSTSPQNSHRKKLLK